MQMGISSTPCILIFVCTTGFASRPEQDEAVHIATSGHFIKTSHHHRKRHEGSHSKWTDQPRHEHSVQRTPELVTSDARQHSPHQSQHGEHHEHVDEHRREELRLKWQHAKREFYKDAEASYGNEGVDWSEGMTFWLCRMAFVLLVIYNIVRYSFTSQHQDNKNSTLKQTQEEPQGPPEVGERPAEERLGKAIDERLCEVERWLQHEAGLSKSSSGDKEAIVEDYYPIPEPRYYQRSRPSERAVAAASSEPAVDTRDEN